MIRWGAQKDAWLRANRGISMAEVASLLVERGYAEVLENPSRRGQMVFVVMIRGYAWVVPFIIEGDGTIFLKTAYPSRKMQRRHGGRSGEGGTAR